MTAPVPAIKGAFVNLGYGSTEQALNTVVFQFNPETMTRTPSVVCPPARGAGSGRVNTLQQPREPTESISFTLRIDATDQLVQPGDTLAAKNGILPALAALEYLLMPQTAFGPTPSRPGGTSGSYRNPPLTLPTVLFYWGSNRILPVTITSLSITETEFDVNLNPVRADVSVSLQVLTPSQVAPQDNVALHYYRQTQKTRQDLAQSYRQSAAAIGVKTSGLPPFDARGTSGGMP